MFIILVALAALAKAQIEAASCTLVADLSTWDLRSMEKESSQSYYTSGSLTWNLCEYIKFANTNVSANATAQGLKDTTFAYQVVNFTIYPLTSGFIPSPDAHTDSDNNIDGITYTFKSDS
jgi:hypothetical protein